MKTYFQYIHYLPNWAEKASAKWRNRSQPDGVDPFRWPKITHKTKNPIGRSGDGYTRELNEFLYSIHSLSADLGGKASAKWRNRSQPDGVVPLGWSKIANKKPDRAIG